MSKGIQLSVAGVIFLCTGVTVWCGQPPAQIDTGIRIEDAAICLGVVERAPIEVGEVFSRDAHNLFCFTRVVGVHGHSSIIHAWYYEGRQVARVELPVHSANWRTYSSKKIPPSATGQWKVDILSREGNLLKQIYFVIK